MKTLHLIRHAKSGFGAAALTDIERTLNPRGIQDAQLMAQPILTAGCEFQNVYCSKATRAQMTIEAIAETLSDKDIKWTVDDRLYTFSARDLLLWLHQLDDEKKSVVIVGHNPGLTELSNYLGDQLINNLPTCSYVQLQFDVDYWMELTEETGKQVNFLNPNMF